MVSEISHESIYKVLYHIGLCLNIPVERADLNLDDVPPDLCDSDPLAMLTAGARQIGISLYETQETSPGQLLELVHEGIPLVVAQEDGNFWVMEDSGRKIEATQIGDSSKQMIMRHGHARRTLKRMHDIRAFVAKQELECAAMSATPGQSHHDHSAEHPTPLRRLLVLLRMEARDIWTVAIFALVAGILSMATPLAIESLVNVVSWGTYWQPLVILALMLLVCLGLSATLRVLQTVVVEIIQRRQLVRIVGDLSHRFPRANQQFLLPYYPRELANRTFDIVTIQKATAILLLDGVSLILTTVLGLLLLAFYHPFLLGFDIVLLLTMTSVIWLLGRGGVRTAIEESITKYEIVHWLQDVLASPAAFKVNGGETLAIDRANRLASEYLDARSRQFRVVLRQVIFAATVQVVASTVLLGLGGWLVIRGQLTLGQLVASELVVTVVVGAFAKAGKSLEKFYNLMAGIDKVGHLLDIAVDPRREVGTLHDGPADVRWDDLRFAEAPGVEIPATEIAAGSRVAIVGDNLHARSMLVRTLAGLYRPEEGVAEIAGLDARHAALGGSGKMVGYAGPIEVFRGTVRENIFLGRESVGRNRTREVLQQVGLWNRIVRLSGGMETSLQTGGYPLTDEECAQLMIARAIAGAPKLLIIEGLLDQISHPAQEHLWATLAASNASWTLLVVTSDVAVIDRCNDKVTIR